MEEQKKKGGRPSKFTEETRAKILECIRAGNFREVAARAAGVGKSTFHHWMQSEDERFADFQAEVEAAEQDAEVAMVGIVVAAAATDPKHAQWWLERKHPERWGRKDAHRVDLKSESTVAVSGGVTVFLPAEETERERVASEPGSANAVPVVDSE